jgi:hypothetical protein
LNVSSSILQCLSKHVASKLKVRGNLNREFAFFQSKNITWKTRTEYFAAAYT